MCKRITLMLMFLAISLGISARDIVVKGKVIDGDGYPVIGATVFVVGTSEGTITDIDGNYSLAAVDDQATLKFSYIGMQAKEVKLQGRTTVNVKLVSSLVDLDEVVVVAYGTQTKRTVTSSISSVGADAIKDAPVNSIDQALQGRATGVSITTPSAGVGEAPIIRVRGVSSITSGTSPLYVIDGVPVESGNTSYSGNVNAMADINPNDILSMDVLKDAAAAAMYGSRAANGVILITTKKGKAGKTKVSYNGYVGSTVASKTFETMDAQQYVDFKNMAVANRYGTDEMSLTPGYTSPYGSKAFNLMTLSDGSYVDSDWSGEVFQTGMQQNHTLSIEGGTDKAQFYLSGNYTDQTGIIQGDAYDRFGMSANASAQATDWLKIGGSVNASTSNTMYTDAGRKGGQYATEGFTRLGLILPPNVPINNEDGTPYLGDGSGYIGYEPNTIFNGFTNPTALLEYGSGVDTRIMRFVSSAYAEVHPFNGLTLRTQYGLDYSNINDAVFKTAMIFGDYENGMATNYSTTRVNKTWTNTATYLCSLGNHHFDFLLGEETHTKNLDRWGAMRTILQDDKFTTFQGAWGSTTAGAGNAISESALLSYFARANYDYDSKYLFSLNFRRDGFSALSENNRWGNFGGVSAAWRISEEGFFEPLKDVVNDFKLKGSWGVVGNTNVDDYAAYSYYSSSYYGSDGAYVLGQISDSENLKWESSEKIDVGISATLWNNLTVDFDYYRNNASDLILDVPVSPSKGIPGNTIITNAGALTNYGVELNIGAWVFKNSDFSWFTSFNFTTTHNEITQLADGVDNITSGSYNITEVGGSIGQLYLYPTAGIDEETGRRIFIGSDGTEVLCMYEKTGRFFTRDGELYDESLITPVVAGNTLPTYYGGWTNNFTYKNFDLSVMMQFSGGNQIYNGTTASMSDMREWNNTIDVYENYWTPGSTDAKYALPIFGDNYSNGSSLPITDWVEDGDYIRCKNISLGYKFDSSNFLDRIGVSSLRLYAQAQNLFVITKYTGYDPEVSMFTQNANLQGGIDKNTLPQSKIFTFGLNLTL